MRYIITILVFCAFGQSLFAQKILKLYRGGDKAYEFFIGQEIHVQLNGGDEFYDFKIEDLDFERQRIMIKAGFIDLKDIKAFKSFRYARGASNLSYGLYTFGAGWTFYSIIDILAPGGQKSNRQVAKEGAIIGTAAFLSGYLIKRFLSTKTYQLDGEMYMLGIVDLDMKMNP